jgi:hypothetical protein
LISEEQNGFRKGRSCTDSIFVIQQLVEKHREYNLETQLVFADLRKAFDSVIRNKLWEIMINRGIPSHLIRVVQSLYHDTRICIKKENRQSKILEEINTGVRQGCPLSPVPFNIYIDDVIQKWQKVFQHNILKPKLKLNTVLFADDQVIIAENEDNLRNATRKLIKIIKEYNLTISTKKAKGMAFTGKHPVR